MVVSGRGIGTVAGAAKGCLTKDRGAATNLRFRTVGKQALKWTSVSDFSVPPRSGRENVAEMCTPSLPPTLTYAC